MKLTIILALMLTLLASCNNQVEKIINTPEQAIERLLEGNSRFVNESSIYPNLKNEHRQETLEHQAPFAAIISCSDSRVPVEAIFDCGIGDIFVIRTAGNTVESDAVMGSIEYAVENLGVKTVIVLGHSRCGAVTAALKGGAGEEKALSRLITEISTDIKDCESLHEAISTNTDIQVQQILSADHIKKFVDEKKLIVTAALYDIETGIVSVLSGQ